MKDISAMAADINDQLSDIRPGSLQFFGDWFGRPHDNIHHIIRAEAQSGVLRLYFDGGETLDAWEPSGLAIRKEGFWIGGARKVRWEWFYYGRPHTQENRFFLEYQRQGSSITGSTNVNWYSHTFATDSAAPAVAMT